MIRTERFNAIVHRLYDGDTMIGFAVQLTNNLWALQDLAGRRIGKKSFATPKAVAKYVEDESVRV